ncbi:unnamed protein product, partial [Rotaria magnacalcarata]
MSPLLRLLLMYIMATLYIIAGIFHFVTPEFYLAIMPNYLPYHLELVYLSGVAEIICGLMLYLKRTRVFGAWLTIALLIAIYPANVQMAQNYWSKDHPQKYLLLARLPFQFVFIWWAYQYTKPIEHAKLLAQELTENFQAHNSPSVIETSYSLDNKQPKRTKYSESETRLIETLENVCDRFLKYNVHAERSGSLRYARGRSQTMETLWNLRNKGVKVVLDVPDTMWDAPSAEITQLKKYCEEMVEEQEENIEQWYFDKQVRNEIPLEKYLCEDRVLKNRDSSCLREVYTPTDQETTNAKSKGDTEKID